MENIITNILSLLVTSLRDDDELRFTPVINSLENALTLYKEIAISDETTDQATQARYQPANMTEFAKKEEQTALSTDDIQNAVRDIMDPNKNAKMHRINEKWQHAFDILRKSDEKRKNKNINNDNASANMQALGVSNFPGSIENKKLQQEQIAQDQVRQLLEQIQSGYQNNPAQPSNSQLPTNHND